MKDTKRPFPMGHPNAEKLRGISALIAREASRLDQEPDGENDQVVAKKLSYQIINLGEVVYDLLQYPEHHFGSKIG
jgi:hypothetical protein